MKKVRLTESQLIDVIETEIKKLNEESDVGDRYAADRERIKNRYAYTQGDKRELSPTQQKLHDDVISYIGQTFASWMSPTSPPFSQEYAKPPYFDKLSNGIRDVIITNVE